MFDLFVVCGVQWCLLFQKSKNEFNAFILTHTHTHTHHMDTNQHTHIHIHTRLHAYKHKHCHLFSQLNAFVAIPATVSVYPFARFDERNRNCDTRT